jgi:GNAT superfamily N-acetyltransferase
MHVTEFDRVSLAERPDLTEQFAALDAVWPAFMRKERVVLRYWSSLTHTLPALQVALVDPRDDALVAKGHAIALEWDGDARTLPEGVDAVLRAAVLAPSTQPTTLCALAVVVAPQRRGEGLSALVLDALRDVAADSGLRDLLAPVRPTRKAAYPLTTIERYIDWNGPDGLPFDPWLRVHARLGGRVLGVAPRSMVVTGTVAEWETWADMPFPDSGRYVVPGALAPVAIDREADRGRYVEPNVWVHHL